MRSCDFNVNEFLRDIDTSLEASRNVFRDFDARFHQITDDEWDQIQLKVIMSPPEGSGDILFFPVRQSVCPSVKNCVRLITRKPSKIFQ